ncbi:YbaB/EbfC family nucleoid-associated protein [Streptomyces sp. NPDC096057]|uniref:YbaB/EbfC family nucleoid-associated protein n=1 Tax=Streptomyces sp. NPDC096057 TaxID=3155543 RepID=UPI00332BC09B
MSTPPGSRLEKALADFAEQHGVLARAREQMRALSVTARSRDGVVEVTVDADGRTVGIRFVDGRFREKRAQQLGDSVMDALTTARAEAAARATAVMMAVNLPPRRSAEPVPSHGPAQPEAVLDTSSACWRRMVREARAVAAGLVSAGENSVARTDGVVDVRESAEELPETSRARAQGPLWGRSRSGARSPAPHALLPAELRDAVMALRASVCDAVGESCPPPVCGCTGVWDRTDFAEYV